MRTLLFYIFNHSLSYTFIYLFIIFSPPILLYITIVSLTCTIYCVIINLYLESCVSRKGVWTILPDATHAVYVWKLVSLDGVVRHLMALFLFYNLFYCQKAERRIFYGSKSYFHGKANSGSGCINIAKRGPVYKP